MPFSLGVSQTVRFPRHCAQCGSTWSHDKTVTSTEAEIHLVSASDKHREKVYAEQSAYAAKLAKRERDDLKMDVICKQCDGFATEAIKEFFNNGFRACFKESWTGGVEGERKGIVGFAAGGVVLMLLGFLFGRMTEYALWLTFIGGLTLLITLPFAIRRLLILDPMNGRVLGWLGRMSEADARKLLAKRAIEHGNHHWPEGLQWFLVSSYFRRKKLLGKS